MPSPTTRVSVPPRAHPDRQPLRFGQGNAKLDPAITTFSLPAGWTCPFAFACQSRADRNTGRIRDGRHATIRCYAATQEARHPSVRKSRWHNLAQLRRCRSVAEMTRLILDSLSPFARLVRVHNSGDFFSQNYFDGWLRVAQERPQTTFYSYTKALPSWLARLDQVGDGRTPGVIPNLVLTASHGGTHDELIDQYNLRSARVVFSPHEAAGLGLEVDHDDSHAMTHGADFALLLHGAQPAGSDAAAAARLLRNAGFVGYGKAARVALPVVSSGRS